METVHDLRWWAGGGDSTGFEVGQRWKQRVWDGRRRWRQEGLGPVGARFLR